MASLSCLDTALLTIPYSQVDLLVRAHECLRDLSCLRRCSDLLNSREQILHCLFTILPSGPAQCIKAVEEPLKAFFGKLQQGNEVQKVYASAKSKPGHH